MLEELDELERDYSQATADSLVETLDVDADRAEIIEKLRVDGEFFIEFFLPEQLDLPVPAFHKEVWGYATDLEKSRILLAIPRDHAKTTLSKLAVIWYWLFTNHRFAVYLSNTNTIAKGACKDIMGFLKTPNFQAVFGKITINKENETESIWDFNLTMPNGRVKRCILRAVGQGQQMRGINIDNQRPDIAVVDDVEDNENTESELQQKKLDKWIFGPFLKALARKHKILWLGNMLQKTSLLARLSRNPKWNPVVYGSIVKDSVTGLLRPLWPGKWSISGLVEDFKEYRDLGLAETWMCEMMNMPGHGVNGFTVDQINYVPMPTPDGVRAAWITIDPAFGETAHADESAVACHVLPLDSDVPVTVAVVHGRNWSEKRIFDEAWQLGSFWGARVWGIEAVAAQKVLITLFNVFTVQMELPAEWIQMIPIMSGKGDPKIGRMRALVNLMVDKEWGIMEGDVDFTTQLLELNLSKKDNADDIVDAVAYGPILQQEFIHLILAMASGETFESAVGQYGTEVEGV